MDREQRNLEMFALFGWFALIAMALFQLQSCGNVPAPRMERPVKLYTGSPEMNGICTLSDVTEQSSMSPVLNKFIYKGTVTCIDASSEEFKAYMSMSWDDAEMLFIHNATLLNKCKKWTK
jgi:hypothetical protein